jgi:tetratricopeptide (TPR) repeat protein
MTELKNTLSGVWCVAAALAYLEFDATRRRGPYAIAAVCFAIALLSKTVTATLPAALLVVFWWRRGRLDWRRDAGPLVPFFAMGVAAGVLTAWVERTVIGATGDEFALPAIARVLLAGRALWFYAAKLVWPVDLAFIYPRWTLDASVWWQYLFPVAAMAAVAVAWAWRRRSRTPLAVMLLFAGILFPALGFFNVYPFRYSFVADHFQYLASVPVLAAIASVLTTWRARRLPAPVAGAVAAAVIAAPLAVLAWRQAHDYVDAVTLYRATLARNPDCWLCYNNLGQIQLYGARADVLAARTSIEQSLRLNPRNAEAHNNLGFFWQLAGQPVKAASEHEEALRLKPQFPEAVNNLGVALQQQGRIEEAAGKYRQAIALQPLYAQAHHNLGAVLQEMGQVDEAIAHIREAIRINPNYADAHGNLARAYQRLGRVDDAIVEYREMLRLAPKSIEARNNMGTALEAAGRTDEAIQLYREVLRESPDAVKAHENLGRALLKLGRRDEALASFREALRLSPDRAAPHYHMGNALQDAGQLDAAVAEYEQALRFISGPSSAPILNDLGVVLARMGRRDAAIARFREVLRLAPGFPGAEENLRRAIGK